MPHCAPSVGKTSNRKHIASVVEFFGMPGPAMINGTRGGTIGKRAPQLCIIHETRKDRAQRRHIAWENGVVLPAARRMLAAEDLLALDAIQKETADRLSAVARLRPS